MADSVQDLLHAVAVSLGGEPCEDENEGIICLGNSCFIMGFSLSLGFWPGNDEKRLNCSVNSKNICRHCEARHSADF